MSHFNLLLLIQLIVMSECRDASIGIQSVYTSKEEDTLLPCFDSHVIDPNGCKRFILIKYGTEDAQMKVMLARPKTSKFQDAERVKWGANENGKMSIFLEKTQLSDGGLFGCEIYQGWDCIHVKNISLVVKECKTEKVEAAPGTPFKLNCPVDTKVGQQEPQSVSWAKLVIGNPVAVNSTQVETNGKSLVFRSVSDGDSGWYRCRYTQTQSCFDIRVGVENEVENVPVATTVAEVTTSTTKPREKVKNGEITSIVVALVVIGIVMTAVLIGLLVYRKHNNQRVAQQPLRHTAGILDIYEVVDLEPPNDSTTRVNSVYQPVGDENLHSCSTFVYR